MDFIRDISNSLGITAETFDYLIVGTIIVGFLLAGRRLYADLTRPLEKNAQDKRASDREEDGKEKRGTNDAGY